MVKNLPAMQETPVGSLSWEDPLEKGRQPIQYPCLENSMDRGAWQATLRGVAKSQTQLSNIFTFRTLYTGLYILYIQTFSVSYQYLKGEAFYIKKSTSWVSLKRVRFSDEARPTVMHGNI